MLSILEAEAGIEPASTLGYEPRPGNQHPFCDKIMVNNAYFGKGRPIHSGRLPNSLEIQPIAQ